jgi:hypothetical protein
MVVMGGTWLIESTSVHNIIILPKSNHSTLTHFPGKFFRTTFPIGATSILTSRRRGLDRTEASLERR